MSHKPVFGGILIFAVFLAAGPGAGAKQDRTLGLEDLQKKIAALEERVAGLEEKLQKVTVSIPQSFPNLKSLPEGWSRLEFNGLPYYVIPLNEKKASPAAIIR
jgi:hypothetical protein